MFAKSAFKLCFPTPKAHLSSTIGAEIKGSWGSSTNVLESLFPNVHSRSMNLLQTLGSVEEWQGSVVWVRSAPHNSVCCCLRVGGMSTPQLANVREDVEGWVLTKTSSFSDFGLGSPEAPAPGLHLAPLLARSPHPWCPSPWLAFNKRHVRPVKQESPYLWHLFLVISHLCVTPTPTPLATNPQLSFLYL